MEKLNSLKSNFDEKEFIEYINKNPLDFLDKIDEEIIEKFIPSINEFKESVDSYPNDIPFIDLEDIYQVIAENFKYKLNLIDKIKINNNKVEEEKKFTITLIHELINKINKKEEELTRKRIHEEKEE